MLTLIKALFCALIYVLIIVPALVCIFICNKLTWKNLKEVYWFLFLWEDK